LQDNIKVLNDQLSRLQVEKDKQELNIKSTNLELKKLTDYKENVKHNLQVDEDNFQKA